ncbi:MAG: tetratricopeptide repeat protein, partial [Dehalococcoidia bacterium]|nr:tetratricopeptide repeat protein [Dehalococcoidia bacterium]
VARTLEVQYSNRLEEHAAELAEHFAQSSDPADLTKALEYSEMAARRAISVYAYGEAVRHLESALQAQEVVDPDDKAKRCDLLLELAEALMPAGEPQRVAEQVAEEAFVLAETLHERGMASTACRQSLEALARWGGTAAYGTSSFRQWAERADRYSAPGTVDRVYADISLAYVHSNRRNLAEASSLIRRALAIAREVNDPEALFFAAGRNITGGQFGPAYEEERVLLADEFSTRSRAGVSVKTQSYLLWNCAVHVYMGRDRARVERLLQEISELSSRTQDSDAILRALSLETQIPLLDGKLDHALELLHSFVNRADELGAPVLGRAQLNTLGFSPLRYLGRAEEGLRPLEMAGADEGSRLVGDLRVLYLAHAGHLTEAQEIMQRTIASLHLGPEEDDTSTLQLNWLLETAVIVGDREAAALLMHRLSKVPWLVTRNGSIARLLGGAAALLGEPEKARSYYQQALEVCAKIRFRPEIALTRLQLAELLLEHYPDQRTDALQHLDFAIAEFTEMKMQPSLERALRHKGLLKA